MTAGHSYIICRRQLRTQPGLEAVEDWSGANGVACKPTLALHLRREVFQVEHLQQATDLDAPARKAALAAQNSMLAFDEMCLKS